MRKIITWGDFLSASLDERQAYMRELVEHWRRATEYGYQRDMEADQRGFAVGVVDEPGPIDESLSLQSSTNRVSKP
jgi:hypothetical protein